MLILNGSAYLSQFTSLQKAKTVLAVFFIFVNSIKATLPSRHFVMRDIWKNLEFILSDRVVLQFCMTS